MLRLLKYIMRVFYANENYAKYGVPGMNYFMALMMATIYILLTCGALLFLLSAASPSFYNFWLNFHSGLSDTMQAIILLGFTFLILRISVKEESLKSDYFTKERVNKAVNYLLLYAFVLVLFIGFLGLKYLKKYH
jgi:hypothetical protein